MTFVHGEDLHKQDRSETLSRGFDDGYLHYAMSWSLQQASIFGDTGIGISRTS